VLVVPARNIHLPSFRHICLVLALLSNTLAMAESVPAQHAKVELIADKASIKPGEDVLLGVYYVLEPGWHLYWINPGDSGQPPSFDWKLPSGFVAGETKWPRPERLSSSQLVDYGYKDNVLFMVPVHASQTITGGASVPIALNAKWLICREVCIPDRAQLHLSLPVSTGIPQSSPSADLFAQTKALLPKPAPKNWKTSAQSGKGDFVLIVTAGKPLDGASFFPRDPGQIDNAAPQKVVTTPTGVRITLKKSEVLTKPVSTLRGLLEVAGGEAYEIQAPVSSQNAQK
jgi:DsbC/DsbD-like thiol-disulfide interchange protein